MENEVKKAYIAAGGAIIVAIIGLISSNMEDKKQNDKNVSNNLIKMIESEIRTGDQSPIIMGDNIKIVYEIHDGDNYNYTQQTPEQMDGFNLLTPTPIPTPTLTPVPTPLPTPEPTAEPSPIPTLEPTPTPKPIQTPEPTIEPIPTLEPTPEPTLETIPVPVENAIKNNDDIVDRILITDSYGAPLPNKSIIIMPDDTSSFLINHIIIQILKDI